METCYFITKIPNERLVNYFDIWLEENEEEPTKKYHTIYIQMELCDKPLDNFIEEMVEDTYF